MWPWSEAPVQIADGHARLRWQHVRIRPTRLGGGMAVACVLLWVLAANYQLNMAYVLLFWLVGVLLFGTVMSARQLLGWRVLVHVSQECFAGAVVQLQWRVSGQDRQRRWLWCCLDLSEQAQAEHWRYWPVGAGHAQTLDWALPPQPRGPLRVPELLCAASAPLGLLVTEARWQYVGDTVVYPAPLAHEWPQLQGDGAIRGETVASSGEDVAYLLPHNQAVSPRQIAWKQYAKSGELLDKWFDTGAPQVDTEVISYRDYPAHTGKEHLAGLLCFRVLQAEQQHRRYTLELPRLRIGPGLGQREQCLNALGLW